MEAHQVIQLLKYYNHLQAPITPDLTLESEVVRKAIQSYQTTYYPILERISTDMWPMRMRGPLANGELTAETEALLTLPRCHTPDFARTEPQKGRGNWAGCNGVGDAHSMIVRFANQPPAFLSPYWDQVWLRVVESYAEVGLQIIRDDDAEHYQTELSFVEPDSNWIGLAIVGINLSCSSRPIWLKFDRGYKPNDLISEWTTLVKHELGHNCGFDHTSGGVMNPFIVKGLPVSFKGDVIWPQLVKSFGGVRVGGTDPRSSDIVVARRFSDGTFEVLRVVEVDASGGGIWPN